MTIPTFTGTVECPECAGDIHLANVQANEIHQCPDCGTDWEVREINPVRLEPPPDEEEDWGE